MATRDFPETVMTGYDRHRQNGKGSVVPQGTIVAKKKGDGWWALASIILILGVLTTPYWLPRFFQ